MIQDRQPIVILDRTSTFLSRQSVSSDVFPFWGFGSSQNSFIAKRFLITGKGSGFTFVRKDEFDVGRLEMFEGNDRLVKERQESYSVVR